MLNLNGWMPYFAVLAIAYATFVFLSESFNPFKIKLDQSRRRWRLGRSIALIVFFVSTFALLLRPYINISQLDLMFLVATICSLICSYPIYLYLRLDVISLSTHSHALKKTPTAAATKPSIETVPNFTATQCSAVSLISAPHTNMTAAVAALDKISTKQEEVTVSEEHQLELEISESSYETDFDNLDQTIAEAVFTDADLTISETTEVAQPNIAPQPENSNTNEIENQSNELADLYNRKSVKASTSSKETIGAHSRIPAETLLKLLDTKNSEVKNLAKSNQSLIKDRESLIDEVSNLKFSIKKINAIARKGIAQRDQAIVIKNNALSIAAMEQKKRKLTEIQAHKAILKMRNTLKALTDQGVD